MITPKQIRGTKKAVKNQQKQERRQEKMKEGQKVACRCSNTIFATPQPKVVATPLQDTGGDWTKAKPKHKKRSRIASSPDDISQLKPVNLFSVLE